ncbi:MAG: NAD(P)/FAD-dependent oxidoreductase [Dehalococcoidia bacterium]
MKVGIVGAGVAGLAAALRLLEKGRDVDILEASPFVGGQVRTFETGGDRLEAFYHHLFKSDRQIIALIEELGLGEDLRWVESKVGFYHGGRIYNFVSPTDLVKFTPVPLLDRMRLGLAALYLRRQKDWQKYEDITAKEWIVRHVGQKAYDVVWGPLLRGKYGVFADEVGMTWFWGKIFLRFASREGGVTSKEELGYLLGSFGRYIEALAARIGELGGQIHVKSPVERVLVNEGRARGLRMGGEMAGEHVYDAVLVTVANKFFMQMTPELPEEYAAILKGVRYQWASCLVLALDRPLSDIYWLNISDPEIPFVAVVEQTNFIEPDRYAGKHYVYLSNYVDEGDPVLKMDVDEVLAHYLPNIHKVNSAFSQDWILEKQFFKDPAGQPIITRNYSRNIPDHRTPIEGLYLANTTQIYPEDRGQNYSILMGERMADVIDSDLQGLPKEPLGRVGSLL